MATYQHLDPRLINNYTNFDSKSFPDFVDQKTDDELYIETWLSKIGKIQINLDSTQTVDANPDRKIPIVPKPTVKISSVKQSIKKSLLLLEKLEKTHREMHEKVDVMSSADWKKKTIEIGALKDEFTTLTTQFENNQIVKQIKSLIRRRVKKRRSQKNRRSNKREEIRIKIENRLKAHKQIDDWLENMKDAVARAKSEENLKKDADCVLSEVTKKKSDARKQLSLISSLIKLRNVRETIALQRGEKLPLEDKTAFNKITEKLTNMWEDVSKVYLKEEQTLRVMLEKNASDEKSSKLSKTETVIKEWEASLFGPKSVPSTAYWGLTFAEKNMEAFVAIRKSWDTFLVPSDDQKGSQIPIGWVLPPENALGSWTNYLCKDSI